MGKRKSKYKNAIEVHGKVQIQIIVFEELEVFSRSIDCIFAKT